MSTDGYRLDQEGQVGVIRLARPPVNAVTFDLLQRLAAVVSDPGRWFASATCLVLSADGPHFSAGLDRAEFEGLDRDRLAGAAAAIATILHGPLPLVSAVRGSAVGTGFILVACADVMVIDDEAQVWLPELEIGMLGGAGHARRWLPMPLVRRMTLAGERLSGTTLHHHGAMRPRAGSTVEEAALEQALLIAGRDPSAVDLARGVLAGLDADAATIHRREMQASPMPMFTEPDKQ